MPTNMVTVDCRVSPNNIQPFELCVDDIVEVSEAILNSTNAWVHYNYKDGRVRKVFVANTVEEVKSRMVKVCQNKQ